MDRIVSVGRRSSRVGAAFLLGLLATAADPTPRPAGGAAGGHKPTHDDLREARRQIGRLEAETALTATRKPYVVLDLEGRSVVIRLMGMTVREIPIDRYGARGLGAAPGLEAAEQPKQVAGIFTLREKEGDPRLSPLTPEQIESGQDDENTADALPPDPPAVYGLAFRQPLYLNVNGGGSSAGVGGIVSNLVAIGRRLAGFGRSKRPAGTVLALSVGVDATTAREIYRLLVPGERILVIPPAGLILPEAGQEAARDIRAGRPAPRPTPAPATPPGVPFRIPPPVESEPAGSNGSGGSVSPDAGEAVPEQPAGQASPAPAPAEPSETPSDSQSRPGGAPLSPP
jgi:hypothetical protein